MFPVQYKTVLGKDKRTSITDIGYISGWGHTDFTYKRGDTLFTARNRIDNIHFLAPRYWRLATGPLLHFH